MATQSRILEVYLERDRHATAHYEDFFNTIARRYDLYRGFYRGNYAQFRNHIQVPFLFSVIQSDVARKVQTLFGAYPYVEFESDAQEEAASARKKTALVNKQLADCDTVTKMIDFFLTGDMYGTAIGRYGWKTERRYERYRAKSPDGQEAVTEGMVTHFDGPDWYVVDILNFRPQPGVARLDDCMWALESYTKDISWAEQQAAIGLFDAEAVEELKRAGNKPVATLPGFDTRMSVYRSQKDYEARNREKFAQAIYFEDMIGWVPADAAADGVRFRLVTVANKSIVMRDRPFPHWDGKLPYFVYTPQADPHYFHGIGKIEIVEKLQYLVNRWASQKADALDSFIDPMWLVNRQAGVDTQNLYTRAGRVIGVDGAVDDSVIRPLHPDLTGMQAAWQEIQQSWGWMQQATGIVEDTMMGLPSSDRQTKAEFLGRQENVLTRQMLEVKQAEKQALERLALAICSLNKQFLQVPREIKMLGMNATVDPLTGMPVPPTMEQVEIEDLGGSYDVRARGSTEMMSRSAKQQNLMGLLQVIMPNPVAGMAINWANMLRYTFGVFDLPNTNEFFNTQPNMLGAMGAAGAGGGGEGAGMSLASILGGAGGNTNTGAS